MVLGIVIVGGISIAAIAVTLSARSNSDDHANELSRLRRRIMDLERQRSPETKPDKPRPQTPQTPAPVEVPVKKEPVEPEPQLIVLDEPALQSLAPASSTTAPPSTASTPSASLKETDSPASPETAPVSFEEKLGMRVFIWIGGISLLLAGVFLVKYSAEQGWLSPPVRVVLGTIFGVVLLIAGEWMRRQSTRIAQALCGAGVADLFACLLAATNLYDLISLPIAFTLMAVLAALAVVLYPSRMKFRHEVSLFMTLPDVGR